MEVVSSSTWSSTCVNGCHHHPFLLLLLLHTLSHLPLPNSTIAPPHKPFHLMCHSSSPPSPPGLRRRRHRQQRLPGGGHRGGAQSHEPHVPVPLPRRPQQRGKCSNLLRRLRLRLCPRTTRHQPSVLPSPFPQLSPPMPPPPPPLPTPRPRQHRRLRLFPRLPRRQAQRHQRCHPRAQLRPLLLQHPSRPPSRRHLRCFQLHPRKFSQEQVLRVWQPREVLC